MEINKHNYEAFLLDLWEGNLSEDQKAMLHSFLDKHPELNEGDALDLLNDVSLTAPDVEFDQESLNFESINEKNYDYYFTAYLEGDLSESEMKSVDDFLAQHPELKKKFDQFKKARLTEEHSMVQGTIERDALQFEKINIQNYQHLFVAYWEGDLVTEQMKEVETFVLNHPEQAKEFDQFKRAKLPLEAIEYPHKSLLIEDATPVISIQSRWLIGVAAASVALFFLFSTPFSTVENKYSKGDEVGLDIDKHDLDPFKIVPANSKSNEAVTAEKGKTGISYASSTETTANKVEKPLDSLNKSNKRENNPKPNIYSRSKIESNGLSNVVATLNKKEAKTAAKDENLATSNEEKIPSILEFTAAYLQNKKVLNEENKPNLKGLLNTTLASNNNGQPVLQTTEEAAKKHTVFRLGDFKFERIAKK